MLYKGLAYLGGLLVEIEFVEFSTLVAYPSHKPTVFVTSHHGLWPGADPALNLTGFKGIPKKF